jgi:uncharacterized OB-fold protein
VKKLIFGYVSCLPETKLVAKFVAELKNERLMGTRCRKCGVKYLPPRAHCKCGSADMEWFEASRQGKILTYTSVGFPPQSMSKHAPYIVAIAELKDGSRLLAQLTDVTLKTLRVGMPVQVACRPVSTDRIVYEFKPIKPICARKEA